MLVAVAKVQIIGTHDVHVGLGFTLGIDRAIKLHQRHELLDHVKFFEGVGQEFSLFRRRGIVVLKGR